MGASKKKKPGSGRGSYNFQNVRNVFAARDVKNKHVIQQPLWKQKLQQRREQEERERLEEEAKKKKEEDDKRQQAEKEAQDQLQQSQQQATQQPLPGQAIPPAQTQAPPTQQQAQPPQLQRPPQNSVQLLRGAAPSSSSNFGYDVFPSSDPLVSPVQNPRFAHMSEEQMKKLVEGEVQRRVDTLYKQRQKEEAQTRKLREEMERNRAAAELKAKQLEAEFKVSRMEDEARLLKMQAEFQAKQLSNENSLRTQMNESVLQEEAEIRRRLEDGREQFRQLELKVFEEQEKAKIQQKYLEQEVEGQRKAMERKIELEKIENQRKLEETRMEFQRQEMAKWEAEKRAKEKMEAERQKEETSEREQALRDQLEKERELVRLKEKMLHERYELERALNAPPGSAPSLALQMLQQSPTDPSATLSHSQTIKLAALSQGLDGAQGRLPDPLKILANAIPDSPDKIDQLYQEHRARMLNYDMEMRRRNAEEAQSRKATQADKIRQKIEMQKAKKRGAQGKLRRAMANAVMYEDIDEENENEEEEDEDEVETMSSLAERARELQDLIRQQDQYRQSKESSRLRGGGSPSSAAYDIDQISAEQRATQFELQMVVERMEGARRQKQALQESKTQRVVTQRHQQRSQLDHLQQQQQQKQQKLEQDRQRMLRAALVQSETEKLQLRKEAAEQKQEMERRMAAQLEEERARIRALEMENARVAAEEKAARLLAEHRVQERAIAAALQDSIVTEQLKRDQAEARRREEQIREDLEYVRNAEQEKARRVREDEWF